MQFHVRILLYFDSGFNEFCSWNSNGQWANIGLGNGVALNSHQELSETMVTLFPDAI